LTRVPAVANLTGCQVREVALHNAM